MEIKVIIPQDSYTLIQKFGANGYIIHFNPINDELGIMCSEDTIFVKNNTKDNLIKAIVDYKYSPEDVNLILCSKINNGVTSEYTKYLNWIDYAKKCASIIFDAPTLENAIKAKLEEITKYDVSSAVNGFYYQGSEYWLDKDTRVGLMNSTKILKDTGETNASLWLGNLHIVLPVDDVIDKLSQLEVYALECYNVTAQHKAAVDALQTIEDVESYDITLGYPTKLDLS